jgi:SAM-dependent methyltransferase
MASPHPTRVVRFQLIATLIGVSIPFAIEQLIVDYSGPRLIATIAFLLTSLNFFHGKVVTLEDDDYNNALTDRPAFALADYVLNLLVVLCFVFMAFYLDRPGRLLIFNLVLRAMDSVLVLLVISVTPRSAVLRAQKSWLGINSFAFLYFSAFLWFYRPVPEHHLATSVAFLALTLADITVDYAYNRKFYFSMSDTWDDMADFWNDMQGAGGDIFRRAVIIPAIKDALKPAGATLLLDAGCGNGCVSRALAAEGAAVVGLDKSPRHLEIARSYGNAGGKITYEVVDLEAEGASVAGGPFDAVVACFTLQDCCGLDRPLAFFARHLQPGGRALVIFENDYSFNESGEHSTTRRWIDSARCAGRGRRQLISWEPRSIRVSRGGTLGSEDDEIASEWSRGFRTITRHWAKECYVEAGRRAGLNCVELRESVPLAAGHGLADNRHLKRYGARPRFGSILFERPALVTEPRSSRVAETTSPRAK